MKKKRWGGVVASMMLPAGRGGVRHSWVSCWSGWCPALMGELLVGVVSGTHDAWGCNVSLYPPRRNGL